MRRRRSRNRSESTSASGVLSGLPRLLILLLVLLPVAEWGAGALLRRLDARSQAVVLSDKDIAKLYDSADPGHYRDVLEETPHPRDGIYEPLTEYRMPPRAGKSVSVDQAGIRGGVIGASGPRVVLFGGSTAFGVGLADAETISAALAGQLGRDGIAVRVENRAVPGWYSTQDRIAFAEMLAAGTKPDVAVFMHGIDDFMHCGVPERTSWSRRLAQVGQPVGLETALRQSALVALGRRLTGMAEPARIEDMAPDCSADADVDAALARLDANRRMIAAMAERFGVKVLFVQQPVPTFHYDNAKRALPLGPDQMAPFVATAKGYARLAELRGSGKLWEQDLLWLAELEPEDGNAYIDPVHYSPLFAKLIGETLAKRVGGMLAVSASPSPAAMPATEAAPQPAVAQ